MIIALMPTAAGERIHSLSPGAMGCVGALSLGLGLAGLVAVYTAVVSFYRGEAEPGMAIVLTVIGLALPVAAAGIFVSHRRMVVITPDEIVEVVGRRRNSLPVAHITQVESTFVRQSNGHVQRTITISTSSSRIQLAVGGFLSLQGGLSLDTRKVLRDVLAVLPGAVKVDHRVRVFVETGETGQLRDGP